MLRLRMKRPWLIGAIVALCAHICACNGSLNAPMAGSTEPTPSTESQLPPVVGTTPLAPDTANPPTEFASELPDDCDPTAQRLVALTPEQYTATVRFAFPGLDVGSALGTLNASFSRVGRYAHDATPSRMSVPYVGSLLDASAELAGNAAEQLTTEASCLVQDGSDSGCVQAELDRISEALFRRPPSAEQSQRFGNFYQKQLEQQSAVAAAQATLRGLLISPRLLYRTEVGGDAGRLTGAERADALAYLISDAPPETRLRDVARDGGLDTPEGLLAEASRMVSETETANGVRRLFREALGYDLVLGSFKKDDLFPDYSRELGTMFYEESARFVQHVLWQDDATVATLLAAGYTLANAQVARVYGIDAPGADFVRVDLPANRLGLLTHPSLMTALATDVDSHLVMRGGYIQRNILCGKVPLPPENLEVTAVENDGTTTNRQLYAQHAADPGCASCHALMDPYGYAFEVFDAMGQYRATQNGQPIDTSGQDATMSFADAPDLARQLADSPRVAACFAQHIAEYVHSGPTGSRSCLQTELKSFAAQGEDLLTLIARAVSSASFVERPTAETTGF